MYIMYFMALDNSSHATHSSLLTLADPDPGSKNGVSEHACARKTNNRDRPRHSPLWCGGGGCAIVDQPRNLSRWLQYGVVVEGISLPFCTHARVSLLVCVLIMFVCGQRPVQPTPHGGAYALMCTTNHHYYAIVRAAAHTTGSFAHREPKRGHKSHACA